MGQLEERITEDQINYVESRRQNTIIVVIMSYTDTTIVWR